MYLPLIKSLAILKHQLKKLISFERLRSSLRLERKRNVKEGYIAVTGGNVYYKIVGDGSKTPIILLHTVDQEGHMFLLCILKLGNDRQVIFYDQLGSGKSDRPTDHSLWNIDRFLSKN